MNAPPPNTNAHIAILRGISRSYTLKGQPPYHALKGIDLTLSKGEFVAILGKSGSGKSTLLNLCGGLDRPSAGSIDVDGKSLQSLSEGALAQWRARSVGVVFQFFQLLPTLSILENVILPMEIADGRANQSHAARARQLLERVGVARHAGKLPHTLSGGEQQRVAIARALANDPPLLLADEPTGNLDTDTSLAIEELLASLSNAGKTIVVVTHDTALASRAQRTVRLVDGEIAADSAELR